MDTYLPWIAGYVLTALAIELAACWACIAKGEAFPQCRHVLVDLFAHTVAFLVSPIVMGGVLIKQLGEQIWDATTAWRRLFRKECGTEELLMGVFWLYVGWAFYQVDGGWWVGVLCVITTVYLWQSAKAMQRLKVDKARTACITENAEPPADVLDRVAELRAVHAMKWADSAAEDRQQQHANNLAWVRRRAQSIRFLNQAACIDRSSNLRLAITLSAARARKEFQNG